MIARIAILLWWFGAALVALSVLSVFDDKGGYLIFIPSAFVAWCASFILGGSFFTPPKGK